MGLLDLYRLHVMCMENVKHVRLLYKQVLEHILDLYNKSNMSSKKLFVIISKHTLIIVGVIYDLYEIQAKFSQFIKKVNKHQRMIRLISL